MIQQTIEQNEQYLSKRKEQHLRMLPYWSKLTPHEKRWLPRIHPFAIAKRAS